MIPFLKDIDVFAADAVEGFAAVVADDFEHEVDGAADYWIVVEVVDVAGEAGADEAVEELYLLDAFLLAGDHFVEDF